MLVVSLLNYVILLPSRKSECNQILIDLTEDECEGCAVHNLFCEKGTGKLHGFTTDGHFAEYSLVDACNSMVLPDDIDMVATAPLFCAGITGKPSHYSYPSYWDNRSVAYRAVKQCDLKPGKWIAVIGCGGLGHLGSDSCCHCGRRADGPLTGSFYSHSIRQSYGSPSHRHRHLQCPIGVSPGPRRGNHL